jgi:hypothetical protein
MNKPFFKYSSIDQFRHVVAAVKGRHKYEHKENHMNVPLPKIWFEGTVKLHGTNAAVVKDLSTGEIWAQSRNRIITPQSDNRGFAQFVEDNKYIFSMIFEHAEKEFIGEGINIIIYGEWVGKGINHGCAIHSIHEKSFFIFGIKNKLDEDHQNDRWLDKFNIRRVLDFSQNDHIGCVQEYQMFELLIDFNYLEEEQSRLERLTIEVEEECPIGKALGLSGIGEGIVWHENGIPGDLSFKTKGLKHRDSKTKHLIEIGVEKIENIKEFIDSTLTDHRLEKMVMVMKEQTLDLSIKNLGTFLKLVGQDIMREEEDRLLVSGLKWKDVSKHLNSRAKQWFLSKEI